MIIGQSRVVRPDWYDRSPKNVARAMDTVTSPHALILRTTYTVPANKRAFLHFFRQQMVRLTVAGTAAQCRILLSIPGPYKPGYMNLIPTTVGESFQQIGAPQILLLAGETVEHWTEDLSTGGTVWMGLEWFASEFDE